VAISGEIMRRGAALKTLCIVANSLGGVWLLRPVPLWLIMEILLVIANEFGNRCGAFLEEARSL
jgi:hypothetical protein